MKADLLNCLQNWDLSNPNALAETATSSVYTVTYNDETVVLKLLKPPGQRDEKCGADALRYFNGNGSVRLLRDNPFAHLLEFVNGPDLKSLVEEGKDEEATAIISGVLNRLHGSKNTSVTEELIPLRVRFRSLFEKASRDKDNGLESLYTKAADVARTLLSDPNAECVLHGDIHHENIKRSEIRGWIAIDPKGLFGERNYDAANVLCNPAGMENVVASEARLSRAADLLSEALHIDRSRLLAFTFAHAALSASWCLEDGQDPGLALRIAAMTNPNRLKF